MTEELKPEAAPVEPLCPFTDRPAWECAAACTCAHFKPTGIIKHAHPPAAPTDALVKALNGYLSDCTNDECERCQNARAAIAAMQEAKQ